jgi:hypothetical protein
MSIVVKAFKDDEIRELIKKSHPLIKQYIKALKEVIKCDGQIRVEMLSKIRKLNKKINGKSDDELGRLLSPYYKSDLGIKDNRRINRNEEE